MSGYHISAKNMLSNAVIIRLCYTKTNPKWEENNMKINQFARVDVPLDVKIQELKKINFYPEQAESLSLNQLYLYFLEKALIEADSQAVLTQKLHGLLATSTCDLYDYLAENEINTTVFYAVAMQLLEFEVGVDFDIDQPLKKMDEYHLYHHSVISTNQDLINAWYDLLCTHTKNGRTYLDTLAAKGYFVPFWGMNISDKPLIFNGKAQPVFDTSKLIREVVYVESSLDTDHDGKRDLLKAEIIRPVDTELGLKVPALYTASPYNQGTNDHAADQMMHNVNVPLKHKEPNNLSYSDIEYHAEEPDLPPARKVNGESKAAEETFGHAKSVTLNDYFLARGFAVVYAAGIGTMDSDGERTCGSKEETLSTTAIIEWLAGKRKAFTNKNDNIEIKAWWCNGSVAMTGKSYLGTLATAAATTGVEGLKTIISEAAISSWYDYYRDGGLVIAPGGFPGEDADILAEECFSRQKQAGDYLKCKAQFNKDLAQIKHDQDRNTGDYNQFWDARNYLKDIGNIKCDVIMVHGLNDWNVKPRNVYNLYRELDKLPVHKKLFLHQGQHIYINNFQSLDFTDMMNLWLTNKLYGVENHANELLPDVCVQDNSTEETWHTFSGWHTEMPIKHEYHFAVNQLTEEAGQEISESFADQLPDKDFQFYQKNWNQWRADLLSSDNQKLQANRLIYKTDKLANDIYLQGCPHVKLRVASNQDKGMLSFMLVDFGKAKRLGEVPATLGIKALDAGYHWQEDDLKEFKLTKETPWKMITKGHINLQNREHPWKTDDLKPNEFYDVELDLQPMFYHLLKGHQLGLVIYSTDMEMTVRGNEDLQYTLQLNNCQLDVTYEEL